MNGLFVMSSLAVFVCFLGTCAFIPSSAGSDIELCEYNMCASNATCLNYTMTGDISCVCADGSDGCYADSYPEGEPEPEEEVVLNSIECSVCFSAELLSATPGDFTSLMETALADKMTGVSCVDGEMATMSCEGEAPACYTTKTFHVITSGNMTYNDSATWVETVHACAPDLISKGAEFDPVLTATGCVNASFNVEFDFMAKGAVAVNLIMKGVDRLNSLEMALGGCICDEDNCNTVAAAAEATLYIEDSDEDGDSGASSLTALSVFSAAAVLLTSASIL